MAMVLIIDDEAPIVDLLADIVEERGHLVLRANNGADGLALARAERPDLIISDVMMPLLDGYTLLRALRGDPRLAHIAVVLISAAFPRGGKLQTNLPADAYLRKPFDIVAVEAILDQLTRDEEHLSLET